MVQFQTFGTTSKYCFICTAPCYVPHGSETLSGLTYRDRQHLCNVRILSQRGISHPGLKWQYNEELNAMTCLGHSCHIYRRFDWSQPDACLTVHRSCYTLLLSHLERKEGMAGAYRLFQRVLPYINSQGVLAASLMSRQHKPATAQTARPWQLCDPTDLPCISFDNCGFTGGSKPPSLTVLVPNREWQLCGSIAEQMDFEESIPQQLLTPPMSPIDSFADSIPEAPSQRHSLHTLPPHILLSIVSYLRSPDITALAQTCSIFRIYLAPTSPVWSQMCRLALNYTPKFLSHQQAAEYYLRVRGNRRLEDQVLVQREQIERVIYSIVHPS